MSDAVNMILFLIEENNTFPSSGPIVCFHNIELAVLDVEIGFEVAAPIEPVKPIAAIELPSRTVAATIDRGPYEKQDPTLETLMKWIPEHGFVPDGSIYYHYLNGEEQLQTEYLTQMFIPVKKA